MRQSTFFLRTQKEFPKDEVAVNARLLIRANFVEKLMAGVYSILPLGFRVRENIIRIIREEMNAVGGAELLLPALHPRAVWDATGRWESLRSIMYQFKDQTGKEVGLGPTHEEIVAAIGAHVILSYEDLPRAVYQIQTKFRNEPRAKSGLLRGREFTMKDLYSFHADETSLNEFYETMKGAYARVFARAGLRAYLTTASGGDFSKEYSHEFMVESDAGEDAILLCRLCAKAENNEIAKGNKGGACTSCGEGVLEKVNAIEVGNIFRLGTRFSEPFKLHYRDAGGATRPVVMGSYGIGVERMMATIVEIYHDDAGILWPEAVAPFRVHLLKIGAGDDALAAFTDDIYHTLAKAGIDALYDDRIDLSAGAKFADADLIGIPWRVVVSERTRASEKVEVKRRNESDAHLMKPSELLTALRAV